jgi:hypothetical protein
MFQNEHGASIVVVEEYAKEETNSACNPRDACFQYDVL